MAQSLVISTHLPFCMHGVCASFQCTLVSRLHCTNCRHICDCYRATFNASRVRCTIWMHGVCVSYMQKSCASFLDKNWYNTLRHGTPNGNKLRQRHLNSGEKMCKLYLPRGLDLLVMCWLQKYSNNICVCTNWRASMTGFVSQTGFLVWGLCIHCMQCYGHTSRCCVHFLASVCFLAMRTHTSAPPGAYENTGR